MPDESPDSLSDLYRRYVARLCRLAERLIGERLGRQYSAEDAAHSALASFYQGIHEGRYRIEQSGNLWALLTTIMQHKIQKRGRRIRDDLLAGETPDPHPSHEEAVELADAIEFALGGFKPHHVEICRCYYHEGLQVGEIAARTGCSRWTVHRVLDRFAGQLARYLGKNPPE